MKKWSESNMLIKVKEAFADSEKDYNFLADRTRKQADRISNRYDKYRDESMKANEPLTKKNGEVIYEDGNFVMKAINDAWYKSKSTYTVSSIRTGSDKITFNEVNDTVHVVLKNNEGVFRRISTKALFDIKGYVDYESYKIATDYVFQTDDYTSINDIAEKAKKFLNSFVSTYQAKYDNLQKVDYKRDKLGTAMDRRNAELRKRYDKALEDWDAENPPIAENDFAVWKSKNGDRQVTVLSIDEPNKRAKINTDKGAIMYVPLSSLMPSGDSASRKAFKDRIKPTSVI